MADQLLPESPSTDARLASYRTLLETSRMLLASASLSELFDRITTELKRLVPYDAVTIYRIDELAEMLNPVHTVDRWASEIMESPSAVGEGVTGWVAQRGEAVNLAEAHNDPRIAVVPGTPEDEHEALACVPLIVRDVTIGTLNVYRLGDDVAFSDHEFELICRFADLAALAIDNAQNRERLVEEAHTDWLTGLHNHRYYHEQLRIELERAHRHSRPLSLIVFDLDDFKLLNDAHGHQEGDLVLRRVAAAAGEDLRASDVACRIGGEEFALLLPETGKRAARAAADRLCARVRELPGHRRITVSCGVASFPGDATTVADLHAAADAALYLAKDRGKDRSAGFIDAQDARRRGRARAAEIESMKQLRALSTLAERLNELTDEARIGETICAELRGLVDYHNVRVYVLDEDGTTLEAIAARGLQSEYEDETLESLRVGVGEGITGTAVALGRSLNVPDANRCEFALDIPGTDDLDESIVAVPMRYDSRTVGVVVLAKLGLDQFSPLSVRLLELLAAQAAVAFENARLHELQRRATAMSDTLLAIAQLTAANPSSVVIADRVVDAARELSQATAAAVVTSGPNPTLLAFSGPGTARAVVLARHRHPAATQGDISVISLAEPEVLAGMDVAAIAPLHDMVLVALADRFTPVTLAALSAVAGQGALALRNAELMARLAHTG